MFDGRFAAARAGTPTGTPIVAPDARVEDGARLEAPCFIDSGAHIKAGAVIGAVPVIGRGVVVEEDAQVTGSIIWPNTRIGQHAVVDGAIIGAQLPHRPQCHASARRPCSATRRP